MNDYELKMELAYAIEDLARKKNIPVKDLIEMALEMYTEMREEEDND